MVRRKELLELQVRLVDRLCDWKRQLCHLVDDGRGMRCRLREQRPCLCLHLLHFTIASAALGRGPMGDPSQEQVQLMRLQNARRALKYKVLLFLVQPRLSYGRCDAAALHRHSMCGTLDPGPSGVDRPRSPSSAPEPPGPPLPPPVRTGSSVFSGAPINYRACPTDLARTVPSHPSATPVPNVHRVPLNAHSPLLRWAKRAPAAE